MHTLVFNGRDEMIKITANEIVFIVADGNYSRARLTTGKDQLLSINLSNVYALLENQLGSWSDQFVRVGRDLIIQNCCIYSIHTLKKRLILKVHETGKYYELEVSKEALKKLKTKQELDLQNRTTNIQLKDNKTQEVYPLQTGNNFFGRKLPPL
jgi:DNA-binding LytR/AlgR family response regulator